MQLSKRGCVFSDLPRRPKGSGSSSCFTASQQKIGNPIRCTHSNIRPYLCPCISVCIVHREAKTKSTSKPVLLSALLFNWNQVWMTNVKCKLEVISNGSLAFTGGYCKQFRKLSISLASSAITDREKGFCLFWDVIDDTVRTDRPVTQGPYYTKDPSVGKSALRSSWSFFFLFFRFPSKQQQASAKVMSPFGNSTFYLIAI